MKTHPILRNIGALMLGLISGAMINGGIISVTPYVISFPPGYNPKDAETLKQTIHLFEFQHFFAAFLAHAVGTFVGGYVAARLGTLNHKMMLSLICAGIFLSGGIGMVLSIPAPLWFDVADLALAYLPMGYVAGKIALPRYH